MGLLTFFKGIAVLWPFLKEILIGNKKIREALIRNKLSTFFTLANIFTFILFVYAFGEARTKDAVIATLRGEVKTVETSIREQKEQYERQLREKDDYYKPLLVAKDAETAALKARVDAVVGRFDLILKQAERDSQVIDTLRRQIDILTQNQTGSGNSPATRNAYSEQLEKLRQEERKLREQEIK